MKKFIITDWARHYKYEVEAENEEQAIDIVWRVIESIVYERIDNDSDDFIVSYDEINEVK